MSANSRIEWTDHTFNPWWGCSKVSPGCDHCYAERDSKRFAPGKVLWGIGTERRTFGDKHWEEPRRWNEKAKHSPGARARVFCASMADVFDKDGPAEDRARLWKLIEETPFLDWQLLTKRVGNVERMVPDSWTARGGWPMNAWLGISVVNQEEANRDIPKLLDLPTQSVRFLSIEPMLGPVNLADFFWQRWEDGQFVVMPQEGRSPRLSWVIAGGESGPHARPAHAGWFRSLRDQCAEAGVPFLFKQWGEWLPLGQQTFSWLVDPPKSMTYRIHRFADGQQSDWYGKKAAGRLLDGITHDGMPL